MNASRKPPPSKARQARKPKNASRGPRALPPGSHEDSSELTLDEIIAEKPPIKTVREFFKEQVAAINEKEDS